MQTARLCSSDLVHLVIDFGPYPSISTFATTINHQELSHISPFAGTSATVLFTGLISADGAAETQISH